MPKVFATVVFASLGLTLGCGNPSGPRPGLNIVSGDGLSDTVGSIVKPPLTVMLLDADLHPVQGQTVYFNTSSVLLVAPISDAGFVINHLPVTTDASGHAAVWVRPKFATGPGKVVVVSPSGQSVEAHYTVLPGAAAHVLADPSDTALYVGGTVTFRPYITDAYGNRRPDAPPVQYSTLGSALSISSPGEARGAVIGRGSVAVTTLGFIDTVWASVVPTGRVVAQRVNTGGPLIVTNLDGSAFGTIPGSFPGRTIDWSPVNGTFVLDVDGPEYLVSLDTMGRYRRVVTDRLMRSEFHPRYARDGSYIYYTGNESVTNCYGVWRVHPDGTALQRVVSDTSDCGVYAYLTNPSPDYASSLSPDGTRLVYVGRTLHLRTLSTGADTSLGLVGDVPRWSPTGEWIAYDSSGTLMLIHPDGTGKRSVLFRGAFGDLPAVAWSPTGEWLLYWGYDQPTRFSGLTLVAVATGLKLPLPFAGGLADPMWQR